MNFSQDYYNKVEQHRLMHVRGKSHRGKTAHYHHILQQIVMETQSRSVLDWGCGPGTQWHDPEINLNDKSLYEYLDLTDLGLYDPCVPEHATWPGAKFYDLIVCTDVLSLIPEGDISLLFKEMRARCNRAVFISVLSELYDSDKKLPNGERKQVTIKALSWWHQTLRDSADWTGVAQYWMVRHSNWDRTKKLTPVIL